MHNIIKFEKTLQAKYLDTYYFGRLHIKIWYVKLSLEITPNLPIMLLSLSIYDYKSLPKGSI